MERAPTLAPPIPELFELRFRQTTHFLKLRSDGLRIRFFSSRGATIHPSVINNKQGAQMRNYNKACWSGPVSLILCASNAIAQRAENHTAERTAS